MKKTHLYLGILLLVFTSCGSDDNGNSPITNLPPSEVSLVSPDNNATSIDKITTFTYNVADGDPDGDTIVYDIYLNDGINETKIAEDYNETSFTYENPLGLNRDYTWRVVAKDGQGGQTESETFSFTTRKAIYETFSSNHIPRQNHTTVFYDNNFVIVGGHDASNNSVSSTRKSLNGFFWNPAPSDLIDRSFSASVVFNSDIYIVGGMFIEALVINEGLNDVYQLSSISDGSSWELITDSANFSPRFEHSLVVFNDKIYMLGGQDIETKYSEVWRTGNGSNWSLITDVAAFGERSSHTSIVFNNKIWVIGGFTESFKNDVWYSENGTDWTLATQNADFTARSSHKSVVYDNKMWVYGGVGNDGDLGDLWYSEDGINWHEAMFEEGTDQLPETLKYHSLTVKDDAMYVIGGRDQDNLINYTIKIQ